MDINDDARIMIQFQFQKKVGMLLNTFIPKGTMKTTNVYNEEICHLKKIKIKTKVILNLLGVTCLKKVMFTTV